MSENAQELLKIIKESGNPFHKVAEMLDKVGVKAKDFQKKDEKSQSKSN